MIIETTEKITLDNLTENSVSVLIQQFADLNGQTVQVGENNRTAFVNSEYGRIELKDKLPEPYLSSVMAVWGDEPAVVADEISQVSFDESEQSHT